MEQKTLVNIHEASRILGVSEAALRKWTDDGKVRAFVTPGGHRRYSRAELKRLMGSHQKVLGVRDVAAELEETVVLHREIARSHIAAVPGLDPEAQQRFAGQGRQLLDCIIKYITEPSKREETVQVARGVGRDMGRVLESLGLPLTDAVEAFLMHREPVVAAVTHLMRKREAVSGRIIQAIPLADHIMDEALVALVASHQHRRSTPA